MKKFLFSAALLGLCLTAIPASAEVGFGADVVSRYVWRGTDFGNAVNVQPGISYSKGAVEVGAWSSWAITGGGANENDLYISYAAGPVSLTLTDYFLPGLTGDDQFFSYGDDKGVHILEVMASYATEDMPISITGAFNVSGDSEDSFWLEATYDLGEMDETAVSITAGAGNGAYTTDSDPTLVTIGVNLSKGDYFASYILNPDKESTFLVFGRSF
jgi:hypothetical protein